MPMVDAFVRSGKVRDLYELPDGRLLLVASDRISAFDVVLPTEIPDKGRVLTALSRFWFAETAGIVPNHLIGTDPEAVREAWTTGDAPASAALPDDLSTWRGRMMICQRAEVVPVEAVVRGFLAGSAWDEYQARGSVCGVALPAGLQESDALPSPIFTPATKAELGEHDVNIDFDTMIAHIASSWIVPEDLAGGVAEAVRTKAIALYSYAAAIAARAGILVADTKFEFGLGYAWGMEDEPAGSSEPIRDPIERVRGRRAAGRRPADRNWHRVADQLLLVDEALTPDSSRFWDAAAYAPGRAQASFDKQFVRDYLETLDWDKTPPGPKLPAEVIERTAEKYREAQRRLTGVF